MIVSAPAAAKSSIRRSGRSTIRCTSSTPSRSWTRSRSAATISAPIEIGGTKWPSITSTWITRAPASITCSTCAPRRAKSAASIEGATRTSCRSSERKAGRRYHATPPRRRPCRLVERRVLGPVLLAVLDLVERGDVAAVDPLAVVVHLVELVGDHAVAALAAVHEVHLAVADEEEVAAISAAQLVALEISDRGHIHAR